MPNMQNILITGVSRGLGLGLAQAYLDAGNRVYGISRSRAPLDHGHFSQVTGDLDELDQIPNVLEKLLSDVGTLDAVYLNAGVLGEIALMQETSIAQLRDIMTTNVWANKVILDWCISEKIHVSQVIAISSGAAVRGNKGWGGYALSKATLNMLMQLYAHEMPASKLIALAPGLVDTGMQDYLCEDVDTQEYPSVQKLVAARNTQAMPGPREAADNILAALPRLDALESGSFVDLRNLD